MKIGSFIILFSYSISAYAVPIDYLVEGTVAGVGLEEGRFITGEMIIDSDFQWKHTAVTPSDVNYGSWLVLSISLHSNDFVFNGSGYFDYSQFLDGTLMQYGRPYILGTGKVLDYSGNMQIGAAESAVNFYNSDGSIANTYLSSLPYKIESVYSCWVFFKSDNSSLANFDFTATRVAPVPEPATMLLFGTGITGLAAVGRRKRS